MARLLAILALVCLALVAPARAQLLDDDEPAPEVVPRAVELTFALGYAQGFGSVADGAPPLGELASAGAGLQVGVGYRLSPRWAVDALAGGGLFGAGGALDESLSLYSAVAGVKADFHFAPSAAQLDPWVSLGTGWRGYFIAASDGDATLQGWDFAKLQLGIDYRSETVVAVSPMLGLDLGRMQGRSAGGSYGAYRDGRAHFSCFVFVGLQGRFDMLGARA